MGPKHGVNGQVDIKEVKIDHIFLLMGGCNLQLIDEAPAGCIVGISDLEGLVFKTATISSTPVCPNFIKSKVVQLGLVKVAFETKELADMESLKQGLMKLDRSDPILII